MPPAKRSIFRDSALASGLVSREQIDQAEATLRSAPDGPPTPIVEVSDELLSAKLVKMGVLTSYQADQLRSGRSKLNLGPYVINDFIGQGGMGHVFKAVHEVMGRVCAVKVLPANRSTPDAISNFTREIRTQAQLDHPNLVRAFDAGHDGKVHYLVTEYVPGTDLRRLVRRQGPLTMQQAARVIKVAATGLAYAHERGMIHRDVKPGNILVTPEGVAKVSDLGLAGFIDEGDEDPRAGKIVGTADYLSPEQIRTPHDVTSVSDIYSLGCTLYYAITGKVPFPGGDTLDKARRHCDETPWHPRRFNADVSEEFVEIIADMMEKDPHARLQKATEVAARLEPWASAASTIPSQQLTKSPWTPPPLPTGELEDTDAAIVLGEELDQSRPESQLSQGTYPLGSSGQDTSGSFSRSRAVPPPLALGEGRQLGNEEHTLVWLCIIGLIVPVTLLVGGILGYFIRGWLS